MSGLGVDPWLAKHPQAEIPHPALRAWRPRLHDQLLIQQSIALETVEGLVQRWSPLVAASAAAGPLDVAALCVIASRRSHASRPLADCRRTFRGVSVAACDALHCLLSPLCLGRL